MFINNVIKNTAANGPGSRYTIWFQGCSRKCPGCANQHLQTFRHNLPEDNVSDIIRDIRAQGKAIEGISLTGGEPLEQNTAELTRLCKELFPDYSIMICSGYTLAEIAQRTEHLLG
jgi:anaerobic ribonucleoside-triphosphate reductase activating protein